MVGTESEKRHGRREGGEEHAQVHKALLYNPSFLGEKKVRTRGIVASFNS